MSDVNWSRIRRGCPRCGGELQHHSLTVWCLRCGWARNWRRDDGTLEPMDEDNP